MSVYLGDTVVDTRNNNKGYIAKRKGSFWLVRFSHYRLQRFDKSYMKIVAPPSPGD